MRALALLAVLAASGSSVAATAAFALGAAHEWQAQGDALLGASGLVAQRCFHEMPSDAGNLTGARADCRAARDALDHGLRGGLPRLAP